MKKVLFLLLAVSFIFSTAIVGVALAQDVNTEEFQVSQIDFVGSTEEYFVENETGEEIQITKEEFDELISEEEVIETIEYNREIPVAESVAQEEVAEPDDASACFELYPFGQFDIVADLDKSSYTPRETAILNLSVTNNNPNTSIESGAVIFQIRKLLEETNTTILLHEEVLSSDLKYPTKETVENNLSFTIPDSLPNGIYQGYIFITDNEYPISGLSFTQDVAGRVVALRVMDSKAEFDIPYVQEEDVVLIADNPNDPNIEEISINPFQVVQTIAPFELPATITVPIYNPSNISKQINIKADLYFWDELDELINSTDKEISLNSNSSENFSVRVPKDLGAGTYMLRIVLDSDAGQVISKIRFSVAGSAPRIYYSGVTEESEMFVCIGNTTVIPAAFNEDGTEYLEEQPFSNKGKTILVLANSDTGEEIDRFEYEGDLFEPWAPKIYKSLIKGNLPANISLSTMVYDEDGNLLEKREASYKTFEESTQYYLIYVLLIIVFVIVIFFIRNRKEGISSSTLPVLILALIITASFSYFDNSNVADVVSVKNVEAQSADSTNDNHFFSSYYSDGVYGASVRLYTNQSIDFLPDSSVINPGSSFNLSKTNYGSWYSVTNGFRTPLFSFSDTSMSSSGTAPMTIMWAAVWTSRHPAVTLNFPYTDTWTTSDPDVDCSNMNVNTANCNVSVDFSGDNVDITQTRQVTIGGAGITNIPGSIMGRDWLRSKVVPGMPTKTIPYYLMVRRCGGSGRGRRCSDVITARSIVIPADESFSSTYYTESCRRFSRSSTRCTTVSNTANVNSWQSLTYAQSCTRRRGSGRGSRWIVKCGPVSPVVRNIPQPHNPKVITLTKTKTINILPIGDTLTTTKTGTGTGTITSSPAGISCGADCSETYTEEELVTLTAVQSADSVFIGWSGEGCNGTGSCFVTMDENRAVTATFDLIPQCSDTLDNDGDGNIDYPLDLGCDDDDDNTEAGEPPQCSDNIDNVDLEDLRIDENDAGCYDTGSYDADDNDETDVYPQCSNNFDDDGDGLADAQDPDCHGGGGYDPDDNNESGSFGETQCHDGLDNDNDNDIDFPADTDCDSASDNDENPPPQCSDTVDNEDPEDAVIDANDAGCYDTGAYDPNDDDETDTLPQCSNNFDDDGDGFADYPEDTGCANEDDNREYRFSFMEF